MQKAVVIRIEMSPWGFGSYLFNGIALALILANLGKIDLGLAGMDIFLIFGAIIAGFICQFMEVGRAQKIAKQRIAEHYPKKV
jgi:hypothetical protein